MTKPHENYKDALSYECYEIQPLTNVKVSQTLRIKEKTWFQILAIITASLISLSSGFLYAWTSPFLLKIAQDKENYNISEDEASYFTITHPIGMLVFPLFLISLADNFGRKNTLLMCTVPYVVSLLIKAYARNVWLLYFARFCAGSGDAMVFASLPVYIGEVATPEVRGIWGNSFIISVFLGQFLVNIVGSYLSVQTSSYIGLTIPVLFLISFSFMPESPYFLAMKGQDDKAKKSLRALRRKQDVDVEFAAIKVSVSKKMEESGSWRDLVTIKANRKALTAGLFLRVSQLLTGVYVFTSYTQFIFQKAGGNISAQLSAIMYTGLTVFMYICAAYSSNMVGRRKAYMISIFFAGIVVLAEAVFFYIDIEHKEVDLEPFKWFPLAGMLSFVVISSFGVGILPTLMLSELFATDVKAKGLSLLTMTFAASVIVANNIFYYFNAYTGLYGPFFLFGACNVVFTFLAYYIVPETKGKTLDEIQETLRNM